MIACEAWDLGGGGVGERVHYDCLLMSKLQTGWHLLSDGLVNIGYKFF